MSNRLPPGRIPLHPEAFSHDLGSRRKRPRQQRRDHLAFIRSLPCLICGSRNNIQAAHIRSGNIAYGKRTIGLSEKSSDHWTTPLCANHHHDQHQGNEMTFWACYHIDPFKTALALFAASGDDEAGELIVKQVLETRQ
jgi:hypothetical protein